MNRKRLWLVVCVFVSIANNLSAQDSTFCTIEKAEETFLKTNLLLLAQKCNVDKQTALIIQSKAYPNPIVYANFNVYDPENDIYFHTDKTGQKDFMFEQLILLGGKRKLSIEIAKSNKQLAEAEFSDLMRQLRYQLHRSFFSAYQYQNNIAIFNQQLILLDTLITSYEKQAERGNIPLKDVIRLKSVYLKVNNERAEYLQLLAQEQKNLRLLTQLPGVIIPQVNSSYLENCTKQSSLEQLETTALSVRPDLMMSNKSREISELGYRLQKRSVLPDPSLNISTDQRGGAFKNQINAGISMPLPLWNQNRGNIKAYKSEMQLNTFLLEEKKLEIKAEVSEAFQNMNRSINEYQKSKKMYNTNFDLVFNSVNTNFGKKNLSILEFVDFFEAYNEALQEFERIKSQIAINAANINYVTGTKIY